MASKQRSQNEFIMQAVAKEARAAVQTMATAGTSRQENAGLKMREPIMKQPVFNWTTNARESINHKELCYSKHIIKI